MINFGRKTRFCTWLLSICTYVLILQFHKLFSQKYLLTRYKIFIVINNYFIHKLFLQIDTNVSNEFGTKTFYFTFVLKVTFYSQTIHFTKCKLYPVNLIYN